MTANLRLLLACSLSCPVALLAEDRISLKDGSILSGTVLSIEADGKVVIDSSLSSKPILLRGKALRSISFDIAVSSQPGHPELLHLVNGDILPGTLRSLDEKELLFQTWYAGEIRVERRFAKAIDFGVTPQKLVYQGPKGLAEWINNDDWEFEDGKLVCSTSGTIAREKILPKQFILRFRLEWENSPNFRIYFCDDYLKRTGNADRYYFEFNSAGSQLKRQTSKGDRRWFNLAQSHRRPEEFKGRGVDVEIRVDRVRRQIFLYLNGEKLQRTPDPIDSFPTGTGIMLQSQAGGDLKNIIPRIEIFEWDAITELRRDEGHDDPKTDGLVDVEGQHISGRAVRLEKRDGIHRVIFESPFNKKPLDVRTSRISSLYFKTEGEPPKGSAPIRFKLRGGGELQLSSLALGDKSLSAKHPLLSDLTLSREALEQLFVNASAEETEQNQ